MIHTAKSETFAKLEFKTRKSIESLDYWDCPPKIEGIPSRWDSIVQPQRLS